MPRLDGRRWGKRKEWKNEGCALGDARNACHNERPKQHDNSNRAMTGISNGHLHCDSNDPKLSACTGWPRKANHYQHRPSEIHGRSLFDQHELSFRTPTKREKSELDWWRDEWCNRTWIMCNEPWNKKNVRGDVNGSTRMDKKRGWNARRRR